MLKKELSQLSSDDQVVLREAVDDAGGQRGHDDGDGARLHAAQRQRSRWARRVHQELQQP